MNRQGGELFAKACRSIPGGVNSPVRSFAGVGGTPRFVRSGRGARVVDEGGRELIDLIGCWGAAIAGHAHPAVLEAARLALEQGAGFGMPTGLEVALAEAIIERVPSVERVRMVCSGTEAVMTAVRIARAATGRTKILKFQGCYHGHSDGMLVEAGSGASTLGIPSSPGVGSAVAAETITTAFNDLEAATRAFERDPKGIAAVIVEPVAGNMGVVPPGAGYLEGLRELTTRFGSLLVFDEVMTGFRLARGGAQELFDVRPDLTTFGKIIGGGLPVGAVGGSADLVELLAPVGPVYQAGTLAGCPVVMASGLAILGLLDESAYEFLDRAGARLQEGLVDALARADAPAIVQRVGSMLSVFFSPSPVRNHADSRRADGRLFADFFHHMLDRGVHLPPSPFEAWFLSLAHSDATLDRILEAAAAWRPAHRAD